MDTSKLFSLCSDEIRYRDTAVGIVVRGKEQDEGSSTGSFGSMSGVRTDGKSVIASGELAGAVWTVPGIQKGDLPGVPASGKNFSLPVVSILRTEDGRITSGVDYCDSATMMRQLSEGPK